ncbi:hypothetical protein, partial [Microcoleus sp. PH2017_02_FOX_O_A]|uniref:hypothetical protein n=1 Tax=Microcoleus sp. PH2017_02_FOX_O_A TaxID=2798813 RepID=UPI0025CD2E70
LMWMRLATVMAGERSFGLMKLLVLMGILLPEVACFLGMAGLWRYRENNRWISLGWWICDRLSAVPEPYC